MLKLIRAITVGSFMLINLIILGSLFFVIAAFKLFCIINSVKEQLYNLAEKIYQLWITINSIIFKLILPTKWDYNTTDNLDDKTWYMLIANHNSWLDILVLHTVFNRKIPHLKFFMKSSLQWVPIVGQVCYVLNYPMITRKKIFAPQNRKHLTAACQKLRSHPTTVANFVEGTRFTSAKHAQTKSKFVNLLPPKTGGVAAIVNEITEITTIIDTTIHYQSTGTMWHFISGQIPNIKLKYRLINIDETWRGDYYKNKEYRNLLNKKINTIWQEKSLILQSLEK
jgi:1-acyl-sn-glycerol-3-phosphate acyltransferase